MIILLHLLLIGLSWDVTADTCASVSETVFDEGPVLNVYHCQPDFKTVFLTVPGRFYRSENHGSTWVPLDPPITSYFTTASFDQYFFLTDEGELYVSVDRGQTLVKRNINLTHIEAHPVHANWALASRKECLDPSFGPCRKNLLYTSDFGQSWQQLEASVLQFSWGSAGKSGIPDHNVHLLRASGRAFIDEAETIYDYIQSPDLGKIIQTRIEGAVSFSLTKEYLFVAQQTVHRRTLYITDSFGLLSLSPAKFPLTLQENKYVILDVPGGAFVNVDHSQDGSWGNTYAAHPLTSQNLSPSFSLSLKFNSRGREAVDFAQVKGMEGIFIANQWDVANKKETDVKKGTPLHTFISFNAGASWTRLSKPTNSKCPEGGNACHLNLIGKSNSGNIASFYSSGKAVGLILSPGTLKNSIHDLEADELDTFMSRDAGETWEFVRQGTHLNQFLDHGSIIVMLDSVSSLFNYSFSLNEALTWQSCQLSSSATHVKAIVAPPLPTSLRMLVHGKRVKNGRMIGVIQLLNFEQVLTTKCDSAADYEVFTPRGKCLLGQKFFYKRRKRTSTCYNGDQLETLSSSEICPCSEEDWECDFCYERGENQKCIYVGGEGCSPHSVVTPPSPCLDTFPVSVGYRLISRTKCDLNASEAVNHYTFQSCPPVESSRQLMKILLGVLLGSVFCLCLVFSFYFRQKILSVLSKVGSQSDWWKSFPMKFKKREECFQMYHNANGHNLSSNSNDELLNINDADTPNELDDDYITKLKESSSSFRDEPGHFI